MGVMPPSGCWSEHSSKFLGTVVAIVEEYHHVTCADASVDGVVDDRFHELVGDTFLIIFLHSLHRIGSFLAGAVDEQVVSFLHAVPVFVAVHRIVTADYSSDLARALRAVVFDFA